MHLLRTNRVDAAFLAETVADGTIKMQYTQTMDMVADIGTKRFTDPQLWLKALYLMNIASPSFWTAKGLTDYYSQQFEDGIPLKPGGIIRPMVARNVAQGAGPKKRKQKREGKQEKGGPLERVTHLTAPPATPYISATSHQGD